MLLYYYTTVLLSYFTTVLLYYYTTILLYYFTTILLYYYTTVLLYYYTTVLLYYCTNILLYYFTTLLLYYYTTILLYYYTTLLLYYCTTGCCREWPNRTQFLGTVCAAQFVLKPQIPGFFGHSPGRSRGNDRKIQEFVASARTAQRKQSPRTGPIWPLLPATAILLYYYTTILLY